MSSSLPVVIGTIDLKPPRQRRYGACDDSSLERLLASFAQHGALSDDVPEQIHRFRFAATPRWNWLTHGPGALVVQANLTELADELQSEFEALERVAT